MTEICFIRHGRTAWNAEGRLQGGTDVPLSDEGRAEVRLWRLPHAIRDWPCFCSPLARARQTAELLKLRPIEVDTDLAEMAWGEFEGRTLDELRQSQDNEFGDLEALGLDLLPQGGESPRQVCARLQNFSSRLASTEIAECVVVTHKGVMRAAIVLATGWDMVGKAPLKLRWGEALIGSVDGTGRLHDLRTLTLLASE